MKIDMYCVFESVLLLVIADVWSLVLTFIKCIVKVMAVLEAKLHEPTNVNLLRPYEEGACRGLIWDFGLGMISDRPLLKDARVYSRCSQWR